MITFLIGGLLILWLLKMSFIQISGNLFEDETGSETEAA